MSAGTPSPKILGSSLHTPTRKEHSRDSESSFDQLATDQPLQAKRAKGLDEAIGLYIEDFADPVVQFSNRRAAELAYDSERADSGSFDP